MSYIKKIISIILIFLLYAPKKINAHIPPIIGLHDLLKKDDIGLGQAFLHKKFIKHIYLYAPKDDPIRNVARILWHIFWGSENDQLIVTKKGPLAVITPIIFGRIIKYVYDNAFEDDQRQILTDELLRHYGWIEEYTRYMPEEIKAVQTVLSTLQKEKALVDMQQSKIKEKLNITLQKLEEANAQSKEAVTQSKKEKALEIQTINKTMTKKSKAKRDAIKAVTQKIDAKYGIPALKKIKRKISNEIETCKEQLRKIQKSKNNILDQLKNKQTEFVQKIDISEHTEKIEQEVKKTIKILMARIENALASTLYPPRTAIGILWAFFESKYKTTEELQECLQEIDTPLLCCDEYKKNSYKQFELVIKDVPAQAQYKNIVQQYDSALYSMLQRAKAGSFTPQIPMENWGYEYTSGKITDKFPDCFEAAMLDIISILWYNPVTEQYDNSLFAPAIQNGIGLKKLQDMLKTVYAAEKIKLHEKTYTLSDGFTTFTSFGLLKKKLQEHGIFQENIERCPLSDIHNLCILHPALRQEWVNTLACIDTIAYHQPDIGCELLPSIENFIHVLNFFHGTSATKLSDFNTLLSYKNRDKQTTRNITFTAEKKERITISAQVQYIIKDIEINFTIKLHMMAHHSYVDLPERNNRKSRIYKKEFTEQLTRQLCTSVDSYYKFTPFFVLLAKKEMLDTVSIKTPEHVRLLYYSLNLTDPVIRMAIAQHALHNDLLQHEDIKKLVFKIKDSFRTDQQRSRTFTAHIIQSKAYEKHPKLYEHLLQKPSKTLGVLSNIETDKIQFCELQKVLRQKKANINTRWAPDGNPLLHKAITLEDQGLTNELIEHKKIQINNIGVLNRTALHVAAIVGNIPIIAKLLAHHRIKANEKDMQQETPLHLACKGNRLDVVQYMLDHPKIQIDETYTPLHAAAKGGNKTIFEFLLPKMQHFLHVTDHNKNTPLHVAAVHGKTDIVKKIIETSNSAINQPGYKQRTPLHCAAKHGQLSTVNLLLTYTKTNINTLDSKHNTPLSRAVKGRHTAIAKSLLTHKQIDVNLSDHKKRTPLNLASYKRRNLYVVKELLKNPYIETNKPNINGKTPLYWAATKGFYNIVTQLLQHEKIDINKASHHGKTPLNRACYKGHLSIIKLLLQQKDIELNKQCSKGKTALDVAKNDTIKKLLLAHDKTLKPQRKNID